MLKYIRIRALNSQVTHGIKLYPPLPPANTPTSEKADDPVVAESYDEVVFTNPTGTFFEQLKRVPNSPSVEYSRQAHFLQYSDADHFLALLEAKRFLQNELGSTKERLLLAESELEKMDEALRHAQEKAKSSSSATAAAATSKQSTTTTTTSAATTTQRKSGQNKNETTGRGSSVAPASKKAKTASAAPTSSS